MSIMSWATAVAAAAIVCDWPTLTDKQRKQEREREKQATHHRQMMIVITAAIVRNWEDNNNNCRNERVTELRSVCKDGKREKEK